MQTKGRSFYLIGLQILFACAAYAILTCFSSEVSATQTRPRSRSFEGTWVAGQITYIIRRKGTGFQVKSIFRLPSRNKIYPTGPFGYPPSWDNWGVVPQLGNTLTFHFRRALPGIRNGISTKTTTLTLSADGQYIDAVSYGQIFAYGRSGPKVHYVRGRMRRKSALSGGGSNTPGTQNKSIMQNE